MDTDHGNYIIFIFHHDHSVRNPFRDCRRHRRVYLLFSHASSAGEYRVTAKSPPPPLYASHEPRWRWRRLSVSAIPHPLCVDTVDRRANENARKWRTLLLSENNAMTHRRPLRGGPNGLPSAVHSFAYRVPFRRVVRAPLSAAINHLIVCFLYAPCYHTAHIYFIVDTFYFFIFILFTITSHFVGFYI